MKSLHLSLKYVRDWSVPCLTINSSNSMSTPWRYILRASSYCLSSSNCLALARIVTAFCKFSNVSSLLLLDDDVASVVDDDDEATALDVIVVRVVWDAVLSESSFEFEMAKSDDDGDDDEDEARDDVDVYVPDSVLASILAASLIFSTQT